MIRKWKTQPPIFRYQVYQCLASLSLLIYMVIRNFPTIDFLIIGIICAISMVITHIRSMTLGMNIASTNDLVRQIIRKPIEDRDKKLEDYIYGLDDIDDKLKN